MASIRKEIRIAAPPDQIWDALRDYGAVHQRVAPGFVTDSRMQGDSERVVTFFNGLAATERLVTMDDAKRRVVYSAAGGQLTHHNASAELFGDGHGGTIFVWTADLLPDDLAPAIDAMMERGAAVMKETFESTAVRA